MNPWTIEKSAEVCKRLVNEGKLVAPPSLGMVTNGLSYTPKFLEVCQNYNCQLTISLDGPREVHDYTRVRNDGLGSYDAIRKNIEKARSLGIRLSFEPTFSKAHIIHGMTLIDLCQWFFDEFGHRVLHAPPMGENKYMDDGDIGLSPEEKLREYCSVTEWGLDNLMKGELLMHAFTHRLLENFRTRKINYFTCPAGTSQLAVSASGDVSPCWMFTDNENFYMGNVKKNDFLGARAIAVLSAMDEYELHSHPECRKCWIQPVCFGCKGGDLNATGKIDGKTDCDFMRAMVEMLVLRLPYVCREFSKRQEKREVHEITASLQ